VSSRNVLSCREACRQAFRSTQVRQRGTSGWRVAHVVQGSTLDVHPAPSSEECGQMGCRLPGPSAMCAIGRGETMTWFPIWTARRRTGTGRPPRDRDLRARSRAVDMSAFCLFAPPESARGTFGPPCQEVHSEDRRTKPALPMPRSSATRWMRDARGPAGGRSESARGRPRADRPRGTPSATARTRGGSSS
jgi:hypothetical protein